MATTRGEHERDGERPPTPASEGGASGPSAAPGPPGPMPRTSNTVNALVHLYRAEVGRMTAWRVRLDTTTNWAITTTGLIGTYAFGNHEASHATFLFSMLVTYFFLHLEARRYRAYESSRYRVLLMERFFYPDVMGVPGDQGWTAWLISALRDSPHTVSALGAVGWRLRRNYGWIYAAILFAWISKMDIVGGTADGFWGFVDRASVGSVPGWAVWIAVLLFYASLVLVAVFARRDYPLTDEAALDMMRQAPD